MRSSLILPLLLAVSCQTITEPDILGDGDDEPVAERFEVVGYHTWWAGDAWRDYDFNTIDGIYFFAVEVGEDGRLDERHGWPESWENLIATARATGTAVIPTVTLLDPDRYISVFSDTTATQNLLEDLVELATDVSADGVHLDFEIFQPVSFAVRQAVTDLTAALRQELDARRPDTQITMFTLAEDGADVLDELALSAHVDQLIVQAYDLHWQTGDTAGPIAPIEGWDGRNWHGILARYAALGVEKEKLSFTIPYFGYEWPTTDYLPGSPTTGPAQILAYGPGTPDLPSARERATLYGKLRDTSSGSPYYAYRDSLGWRQGWFEDAESIAEKYDFAIAQGLGGVAIFPLSYGDQDLLTTLATVRADLLTAPAP
ncbi:MAG: hypothetical protein HKN29_06660 [Rhodothermales bacterium]|nr:hypothetical protein [Rhodothermales bacterium]